MAPAMINGTSGSAPASSATPIKISIAIAMKNTNKGLIRAAAATTENLAQVRNCPMVGRPHRANACHTWHMMVNRGFIDVPVLSVKHGKPSEPRGCRQLDLAELAQAGVAVAPDDDVVVQYDA